MRSRLVAATLLVTCLVASVALAARDKVEVIFQSLQASGVTGEATLSASPSGEVMIHAKLRGLEPRTQYSALIFDVSTTCDVATTSEQVVLFESNPAGIANFNQKVVTDLTQINSIGIRLVSDNSLKACASVIP